MGQYILNGKDYTNEFDPVFYAEKYADLKAAFGYDILNLLNHWVIFGKKEKRQATDGNRRPPRYVLRGKDYTNEFDPDYYANKYADLKAAFGYDIIRLLDHWIVFGKKEKRQAKDTPAPTKRTWKDAVTAAIDAYRNREQIAYFDGAWEARLTQGTMDYLWNAPDARQHFAKYTAEEKAQIYRNSLNKMGYDCAGFTGWVCTGDHKYGPGQIANAVKCSSIDAAPAGALLWTTYGGKGRHIGLYLGLGYFAHVGGESTDERIRNKRDSVIIDKLSDNIIPWEAAYMSNVLDYTGAVH